MRSRLSLLGHRLLFRLHSTGIASVSQPTVTSSSHDDDEERIKQLVLDYSNYSPSPLSIKQLTDFGKTANVSQSFNFLRKEMPIRLAATLLEFDLLPEKLAETRYVSIVKNWYKQSFKDLMQFRDKGENDLAAAEWFTRVAAGIKQRHANVVETMAQGINEMKEKYGEHTVDTYRAEIQYFLDRFYMNRISMRLLLSQHVALFADEETDGHNVGIIDTHCNVVSVIQDAATNARRLCESYYSVAPAVTFRTIGSPGDGMTVAYVASHLFHIMFELLKNSCRAVVEHHSSSDYLPAIEVMVTKGKEDICIKVSDQGGGINRSALHKLFHYHYSTAPQPDANLTAIIAPLAGYGYGLPLSRIYARYFTGDLLVTSMKGYGTDVHVYLKKLSSHAKEVLPLYGTTAKQQYKHKDLPPDWSSATHGGSSHRRFSTFIDLMDV
ncbi:pyruvate dehydrogenase (acetyl-transferring) kinase, mitochondrial-like isoform X2 [Corticium candelabrum]|nr:pyruvate dehydrogenase (acetyl-transferring) kinase, mitochondrial-like isoform X2 [Corticium candelabrum]XP_062519971.1 pyruvate dehydrogenase (acetyl-transferring) kinase, mitochondrial-like isoform X2 [Corticium candelabrum]XP_062519972.1 pyruvate dehydrogenase (acetyl-transferring) kinase, mitochondrial-like isoform X2 [Corticium candelabrum]XP_062519973.1 pyruvate dehydrogenase (acetyl-transferring) kinase, mitochondrial-like isoform X2 [Corticium candelabrum]